MILLSGHSLTHSRKVPLEALSLQLKERDSTATMTPADMTGIGINSWLRDDTNPGAGIVWRVKSISQAFATDTPTVTLEHVINTLRDNILFGEITPATITGNPKATTCSAEQAVRFILARSSDWVLGSFSYGGVSNPYKFDGDSLYDALEIVSNSLNDAWWSYDMSVYPFRLNITAKTANTSSELRAGRNLTTITKTVDRSAMITRFYPIGKDDLHIPGDCVERNTNLYGVVSKVETDTTIEDVGELRRWAEERIKNHCEPDVTIDVEGFELADATGESLDRLTLGSYCRVPLPEFGTTITERIVTINYPDKIHQPTVFRVELANTRTDVTRIIADAIKGGTSGKGGRGAARQQKEDHAWIEDTEDHVALCAEAIIGRGPDGVDWRRFSTIVVDGEGIHQRVEKTEGDVVTAFTQIDANEKRIQLEAQRAIGKEGELSANIIVQADRITSEVQNRISEQNQLSSRITQTATAIQQEVSARILGDTQLDSQITQTANKIDMEVTRATTAEGLLSGRITVEAGKITQIVSAVGADGQVTAASICLAINNGGSSATINADKIYLLGQTIANTITANYIDTKVSSLATLHAKDITCNSITAGVNIYGPNGLSLYANGLWTVSLSGPTNNVYTLKQTTLNGTETTIGTFSRATSLTGAWSGGTFTVNASPQGDSQYTTIKSLANADVTWNGVTGTFNVQAYNNGAEIAINTGRSMTITAPFTQTTVTLQGNQETVYAEMESGGSDYYTADAAVTYYESGSQYKAVIRYKGGSAITKQGDAGPKLALYASNTTLYYKSGNTYVAATGAAKDWYYNNSNGTQYYKAGSAATQQGAMDTVLVPIEEGETGSYFLRGSSVTVTPINVASKKHLVSTIRYKAGSSATYYTMKTPPEE